MKGKDFISREAEEATKQAFNPSTQANTPQSPYFRGQINLDRTKITDTITGKEYNLSFTGNPREFEYACAISDKDAVVSASSYKMLNVDGSALNIWCILQGNDTQFYKSYSYSSMYLYNANTQKICSLNNEINSLIDNLPQNSFTAYQCAVKAQFSNDGSNLILVVSALTQSFLGGYIQNESTGYVANYYKNFKISKDKNNNNIFAYSSLRFINRFYNVINFSYAPGYPGDIGVMCPYQQSNIIDVVGCLNRENATWNIYPPGTKPFQSLFPVNGAILTPIIQMYKTNLDAGFPYFSSYSNTITWFPQDSTFTTNTGGTCPPPESTLYEVSFNLVEVNDSTGEATGVYTRTGFSPDVQSVTATNVSFIPPALGWTGPTAGGSTSNNNEFLGSLIIDSNEVPIQANITLTESRASLVSIPESGGDSLCAVSPQPTVYEVLKGPGLINTITDYRLFRAKSGNVANVVAYDYSSTNNPSNVDSSAVQFNSNSLLYEAFPNFMLSDKKQVAYNPLVTFTDKIYYLDSLPNDYLLSSIIKPIDSYKFLGLSVPDVDGTASTAAPVDFGSAMVTTTKEGTGSVVFDAAIKPAIEIRTYTVNSETNKIKSKLYKGKLPPFTLSIIPAEVPSNWQYILLEYTLK